jgi:hypothetical protein
MISSPPTTWPTYFNSTLFMGAFQDPRAAITYLEMTQVVGGDLVKIMIGYDKEWVTAASGPPSCIHD